VTATARRVLLTTCPGPYPEHAAARDGIDQYGMRFTKHQELFQVPIEYPFHLGVHFIARNLDAEVTVLDAPPPAQLVLELARQPALVGISFPVVLIPRALEVARLVRRLAPRARLVLGGHGVVCLAPGLPVVETVAGSAAAAQLGELAALADEICLGEGIAFVRRLIGQDPAAPVDGRLPPAGIMRPFGLPLVPLQNMVSLAPAMGCSGGCDFCTTGAFFGGRRRVILEPEQAVRAIGEQLARVRDGARPLGVVMDEDLLVDRTWFSAFGEALARDERVRRTGFTFTAFGSVRGIERYDVEELVRWRVSNIWIGVETTLPQTGVGYLDRKRRGGEAQTFARLHAAGITTTASTILGWDFHDRSTIRQDIEAFLPLRPTMCQVLPLIPAPGTRLWAEMAAQGRLRPVERWEDLHYYGRGFRYRHFTVDELWRHEDDIEQRLYREQGPSYLKMAEVYLSGARRFRGHADRQLAGMADVFCGFLDDLRPVLPQIVRRAPSAIVAEAARRVQRELDRLLGPPSIGQRGRAAALAVWTELRRRLPRRPYQPTPQRTVYSRGRMVSGAWSGP
jgi:hypothetical protein